MEISDIAEKDSTGLGTCCGGAGRGAAKGTGSLGISEAAKTGAGDLGISEDVETGAGGGAKGATEEIF